MLGWKRRVESARIPWRFEWYMYVQIGEATAASNPATGESADSPPDAPTSLLPGMKLRSAVDLAVGQSGLNYCVQTL
jgi:hypothetical protein